MYRKITIFILIILSQILPISADAKEYTEKDPMVILVDFDFSPYSYKDDAGQPRGFYVDLMQALMGELDIPYVFSTYDWETITSEFEGGNGDVILGAADYVDTKCYKSGETIGRFRFCVIRRNKTKSISAFSKIPKTAKVSFFPSLYLMNTYSKDSLSFARFDHTLPSHGVEGIVSGKYDYYIIGEQLLKNYEAISLPSDLVVENLETPIVPLYIIARDSTLMENLNQAFANVIYRGTFRQIERKWYDKDSLLVKDFAVLSVVILVLFLLIIVFITALVYRKLKERNREIHRVNIMANEALRNTLNTYWVVSENRIYGVSGTHLPEEGISEEYFYSMVHPDDRENFRNSVLSVVNGEQETCSITYRYKSPVEGKEWLYLRANVTAEKDSKGEVDRVLFHMTDETEIVEQQKSIEHNSWIFKQVFDTSIVAQSYYDGEGKLINFNATSERIFSRSYNIKDLWEVNFFDLDPVKYMTTRETIDNFSYCTWIENKVEGGKIYLEIIVNPVRNDDGSLLYIVTSSLDVTDIRNVYLETSQKEREVLDTNVRIKEYAKMINYLLTSSKVSVWHLNLEEKCYYTSNDLVHEEKAHTMDDYSAMIIDDTRDTYEDTEGKMLARATNVKDGLLHVRKDGATSDDDSVWLMTSVKPTFDEEGNVISYYGVQRDVTEIVNMTNELSEETEKVTNASKLKSLFLANMTHEIRTPLNAIVGFSDVLNDAEGEMRDEVVGIIKKNCELLTRLINDILDISVMDEGLLKVDKKEVDFAEVFSDTCETIRLQNTNPNVEFIEDNPYESLVVLTDEDRVTQVITNFASNAFKYTEAGHVKVGYKYTGEKHLYLYCEDTGKGIPSKKKNSIFEKFVKLDDFIQGSGLGLSICKAISEALGGKIGVDSEEGEGSTFWMSIPCEVKNIKEKAV